MPAISILTPVYNAARHLHECLDSVLGQTLTDWQLLCIDDGSTDESLPILQEYAARDARIELLQMDGNCGLSAARNAGLLKARGSFVLMLDADDALAPDALQQLWKAHRAHPDADALLVRLVRTYPDGHEEEHRLVPMPKGGWTGAEACKFSINYRLHGVMALRRELHLQWPYDTSLRLYADDVTVRMQLLHCKKVVATPATYYYRQHEASATHTGGLGRLDFVRANMLLRRNLEQARVDSSTLAACEDFAWRVHVGITREMLGCWRKLSAEERKSARQVLRTSHKAMRPFRLPLATWTKPAYFPLLPFSLYWYWQLACVGRKKR